MDGLSGIPNPQAMLEMMKHMPPQLLEQMMRGDTSALERVRRPAAAAPAKRDVKPADVRAAYLEV